MVVAPPAYPCLCPVPSVSHKCLWSHQEYSSQQMSSVHMSVTTGSIRDISSRSWHSDTLSAAEPFIIGGLWQWPNWKWITCQHALKSDDCHIDLEPTTLLFGIASCLLPDRPWIKDFNFKNTVTYYTFGKYQFSGSRFWYQTDRSAMLIQTRPHWEYCYIGLYRVQAAHYD